MVTEEQDGQRDIQPFIERWTRTVEGAGNRGHLQGIGHHRGQKIRALTNRRTNRSYQHELERQQVCSCLYEYNFVK